MKLRLGVTACLLLALIGCIHPLTRTQSGEDAELEEDLAIFTVGDVTEVANVAPVQVSGVGLVTGLQGTGGSPPGSWRKMLEQQLRKMKVENPKQLLASPNNALVLVTAFIPPGASKGDELDIEVTLPPGSKATSLRGGYLQPCPMRNYETTKNLKPDSARGNRLLSGHILAKAKGQLMVGLGSPDEAVELKRAMIWSGGMTLIDRPFYLVMKKDHKFAQVSNAVASRINLMFQDDPRRRLAMLEHKNLLVLDSMTQQLNQKFATAGLGETETAKAISKEAVAVRVPFVYRYNPQRYLRVARLIPLQETKDKLGKYRQRLEDMVDEPQHTVRAALRLEALGQKTIPVLKKTLEKSDHPLVQFATAESLTYLGNTAGVETLARLAKDQPILRAYCLLALTGLDEGICRTKLTELMAHADVELRSGAFRALRDLDERNPRLHGEYLQGGFWVHRVAPNSPPLVHVSASRRAEIVLFGRETTMQPPFKLMAGPEFIVGAAANDKVCTISRFQDGHVARRQCSLEVDDVLRTLAEMGGQYADAVNLLKKASDRTCLSCAMRVNALPEQTPVETLVHEGRDPQLLIMTETAVTETPPAKVAANR